MTPIDNLDALAALPLLMAVGRSRARAAGAILGRQSQEHRGRPRLFRFGKDADPAITPELDRHRGIVRHRQINPRARACPLRGAAAGSRAAAQRRAAEAAPWRQGDRSPARERLPSRSQRAGL